METTIRIMSFSDLRGLGINNEVVDIANVDPDDPFDILGWVMPWYKIGIGGETYRGAFTERLTGRRYICDLSEVTETTERTFSAVMHLSVRSPLPIV